MITSQTAVGPQDCNRNMSSNSRINKGKALALECSPLLICLDNNLFGRITTLLSRKISTLCKMQLREKLKNSQARISTCRKE